MVFQQPLMPSNSQTRPRTRAQRERVVPPPTLHANGAAQINFHVNLAPEGQAPASNTTARGGSSGTQPAGSTLPTISENPATPPQRRACRQTVAPVDQDDNPFIASGPPNANVQFHPPRTPASVGAETFPNPSPSETELNETPTSGTRLPQHTPLAAHTPQVPRARGTPRAGMHSHRRSYQHERRETREAKKRKARDVWTFFDTVNTIAWHGRYESLLLIDYIPKYGDSTHVDREQTPGIA
ncbi:hypothetical protein GALMADRAFT_144386 [Galerina marginata CBS 339.88]|uniref:Uncharacterized protein n=1 Tax=Galerina marginata (strain CBS 339.88) TaxID=685588 RepID=A0A067SLN2_GALM3|nr:hypothetical protein GALMADRAFT_144386 [Galerina marginata CBS 339.88]